MDDGYVDAPSRVINWLAKSNIEGEESQTKLQAQKPSFIPHVATCTFQLPSNNKYSPSSTLEKVDHSYQKNPSLSLLKASLASISFLLFPHDKNTMVILDLKHRPNPRYSTPRNTSGSEVAISSPVGTIFSRYFLVIELSPQHQWVRISVSNINGNRNKMGHRSTGQKLGCRILGMGISIWINEE